MELHHRDLMKGDRVTVSFGIVRVHRRLPECDSPEYPYGFTYIDSQGVETPIRRIVPVFTVSR